MLMKAKEIRGMENFFQVSLAMIYIDQNEKVM